MRSKYLVRLSRHENRKIRHGKRDADDIFLSKALTVGKVIVS